MYGVIKNIKVKKLQKKNKTIDKLLLYLLSFKLIYSV